MTRLRSLLCRWWFGYHRWNVWIGLGAGMVPDDGTSCTRCGAVYTRLDASKEPGR